MFKIKSIFEFEKKLVFLINFFMVIIVILSFLFHWKLQYFFYFNIILTLLIAYLFFKRSRHLSKELILTNLFIFFYFLYPNVSWFFTELFGNDSYIYILFYTILISYIFLLFSGEHKNFFGNIKNINFPLSLVIILIGIFIGFLFFLIQEPIPFFIAELFSSGEILNILFFILFTSFLIALSEQMIFAGFLYNSYKKLTSKIDAFFQTAIIFVLFHILRFEILVKYYYEISANFYIIFIILYYILLFCFMVFALYLYSLNSKKYKGSFLYPFFLHFGADIGLFMFYLVSAI